MHKPLLLQPLTLRSLIFRNRIGVSPMCQYSCVDGMPGDWHLVHLGARAVGGAGLVMVEATAVTAEGRISPGDAGIWSDRHVGEWKKIAGFVEKQGAVPGIQLAHAGWKGSTAAPWLGGQAVPKDQGGWQPVGVGDLPFAEHYPTPRQLSRRGPEPRLPRLAVGRSSRPGCGIQADRNPRRARLPAAQLPLARFQSPN